MYVYFYQNHKFQGVVIITTASNRKTDLCNINTRTEWDSVLASSLEQLVPDREEDVLFPSLLSMGLLISIM
jgi:hypothetical protein